MTIGSKKNKLSKTNFVDLGLKLGLTEKQIENTFKRFLNAESKMITLIEQSFLNNEYQKLYIQLLQKRLELFK